EILKDHGMEISKYAVEIARHSGRKPVTESDVRLASTK
ncbi:MAG: histone, partial [Candidatus Thorarchaeota archaeon]